MTISRSGFHRHFVAIGLIVFVAFALTACVSVKDSGTKASAPPPPTTSVMFDANYRNAEVYIDGEFRGTAPVNLHLVPGTHVVEFKLQGHQTWKRELVVVAGNDTRVAATLKPE
jgi:hypothetical protein